jgi:polysaccharide export outer membrane protein
VLFISVWKDESLTQQVSVLPDGTISFPLIGEIWVDGRTVAELKADIGQRLARYIPDATLSVQVMQVNSQVIYVIGKVNGPGRFPLVGKINVLQALAMAGGLNPFAKSGRIRIFRETGQGTQMLLFDYDEVARGERLEQNIQLERGDVIVVH